MEQRLRRLLPNGQFAGVPTQHTARMRAIKSTGNRSTEKRARAILIRAGVRGWQMQPAGLVGKPDFLFAAAKVVLFIDGCYWHGCGQCSHAFRKNRRYWNAKIAGNSERDRRNDASLRRAGYRVLRVWEHELSAGCDGKWLIRLKRWLTTRLASAIPT
jgi:DNA mismatch endonuclease Vsr